MTKIVLNNGTELDLDGNLINTMVGKAGDTLLSLERERGKPVRLEAAMAFQSLAIMSAWSHYSTSPPTQTMLEALCTAWLNAINAAITFTSKVMDDNDAALRGDGPAATPDPNYEDVMRPSGAAEDEPHILLFNETLRAVVPLVRAEQADTKEARERLTTLADALATCTALAIAVTHPKLTEEAKQFSFLLHIGEQTAEAIRDALSGYISQKSIADKIAEMVKDKMKMKSTEPATEPATAAAN